LSPQSYEETLQGFLVSALYARVGEPGTMTGEGKNARFQIRKALGGGLCEAEGRLEYALPSGAHIRHKTDILFSLSDERYVAVELKWVSNVSDQFKARAYDMLHLKKTLGPRLRGMMVYLHTGSSGLSADRAREFCYPFDEFIALEHQDPQNPIIWAPVLDRIEAEITPR
jgi:hypothetical protein